MTITTTTALGSAREVIDAIGQLGLPLPTLVAMRAISKGCRAPFLDSLATCLTNTDPDGQHRRRLEQTLLCVGEATGSALEALGHPVSVEDRALIALSKPQRFLSALGPAADPGDPRHADAKAFLDGYLGKRGWEPDGGAAEQAPSPTPADVPSGPVPATPTVGDQPAAPDVVSSPAGGAEDPTTMLVHGTLTALRFEALCEPQSGGGLRIVQAPMIAPRFDWEHAISVVLEPRQIAACLAVLRRWRGALRCEAGGGDTHQVFVLAPSGKRFRCGVAPANDTARVPLLGATLGREEAFSLAVLFLQQLMLARPGKAANQILAHVRATQSADPA